MTALWDYAVRFRTWLVNVLLALLLVAPDLLNSPELLAVFPAEWQRYVIAAGFLANILMRPWPAVRAGDPETKVRKR